MLKARKMRNFLVEWFQAKEDFVTETIKRYREQKIEVMYGKSTEKKYVLMTLARDTIRLFSRRKNVRI